VAPTGVEAKRTGAYVQTQAVGQAERGGTVAEETRTRISQLLAEHRAGDAAALDDVFGLLYEELREIARRQRRRWHGAETLGPTVLVHEAYLKLAGPARGGAESRAHFLALASRAMRHLLCNHARDRKAAKRGGGLVAVALDDACMGALRAESPEERTDEVLALDDALQRLHEVAARLSKVVECRFFGGMTIEETAAALDVSPRTVRRDWALAQAWLHRELTRPGA
jgi:RNA polymerase sigma factor (TIGR02999 family)